MIERSRRVVLLIDYDNLQICASRDTPGRDLQLAPVVQLAQHYGTVILARAYAEWNLSTERLAVYKAGIEPAFAPVLRTEGDRSGKSLADTVMVAEGMDMLWTLSPEVVVLATSDKDLIPLVRVAKQRGAFVVVLGSDFTAIPLREMADEHVTYRQLITDGSGRFTTEAGPIRQQQQQPAALPESPRRRPRERIGGRERTAAPAPVTAPTPAVLPTPVAPPPVRVEREPAPAFSAEPVAPLSVGLSGDAEAQGLGRRRRRRGSRRRTERVGLPGEGGSGFEGGVDDYGEGPDDSPTPYHVPYAEPDEADEALDGLDDATEVRLVVPQLEPIETHNLEPHDIGTNNVASAAEALAELELAPTDVEAVVVAPPPATTPALRDRRRRSRRPAGEAAAVQDALQLPSTPLVPDPKDAPVATIAETVVSPPEPVSAPASTDEATDGGEPAAEEPAPVRRTRRRTTGPTAGRARPATS